MKKRLTIAIMLILLASAGLVAAHLLTNHNGQDVKISETTLAGNFDAAKGVQVKTEVELYGDNPMAWETTTVFNQGITAETEVYPKGFPDKAYHNIYINVLLTSGVSELSDGLDGYRDDICYVPLDIVQSIADSIGPGETGKDTVNLGQYVDTMPLDISIDSYVRKPSNAQRELSMSEDSQHFLAEHLTIPVPDDYPLELEIKKDGTGQVEIIQYMAEEFYSASASAYVGEENCYMAVNGYKSDDTDQFYPLIQEEYRGILMMPIDEKRQIEAQKMKCIYPLDDDIFIEDLTMSADGQRFLLLTVEENAYCLHVIDRETLTLKQKLKLSDYKKQGYISTVVQDENFYLALIKDYEYVIATCENGTYQYWGKGKFDTAKLDPNHDSISTLSSNVDASFDGERCVIAALAIGQDYNLSPSYYLQVVQEDETLYYGRFDSSLFHDLQNKDTDANIDVSFVH